MSTLALARTGRYAQTQTRDASRLQPLLSVMEWEFRRLRGNRLFWLQALGFFCLALFFIGATQGPSRIPVSFPNGVAYDLSVAGTSVWGLLLSLQAGLLLLPGLLLPFVNADGVSRDLQRRTHELLMTTALPSRSYIWGRYLVGLLVSLGLALLLLGAILGMYLLLHLTVPTDPPPQVGAALLLWAGMIVPASVLLSSVSFALGTLASRQSTMVKVVMLLAWFIGVVFLASVLDRSNAPAAGYSAWDPTSAATVSGLLFPYQPNLLSQLSPATGAAQAQRILLAVENTVPSVASWLAPHLILAGLSLLLVALVAFSFRRFQNAFEA